jgi:homoserine O-succinyltransferase
LVRASTHPTHWRNHAHLLFDNWIDEVYQGTPYSPAKIGG